jgi:hypothetical protein
MRTLVSSSQSQSEEKRNYSCPKIALIGKQRNKAKYTRTCKELSASLRQKKHFRSLQHRSSPSPFDDMRVHL